MAGLSLLAAFVGRPASGLRLLCLAVTALVLIDPFLVHSVGFQLSCGASAGIVLLARPLAARLPGPGFVRQSLAVTAAAQLGVAPVVLPTFGGLPLVALPANLAAAPAAAALTVWGLGSGLAGGAVGRWWAAGATLLQVPTGVLAGYLAAVAAMAARIPVAVTPGQAKVLAGLAAVAYVLRWGRRNPPSPPTVHSGPVPARAGGRARAVPGR
jgi:competence protein ComEC